MNSASGINSGFKRIGYMVLSLLFKLVSLRGAKRRSNLSTIRLLRFARNDTTRYLPPLTDVLRNNYAFLLRVIFFSLAVLWFVPEGKAVFAQTAFDVEENIKYLKDVGSSLKAQAQKMAVLEEQLDKEEQANIQLNQRLNELNSDYSVFLADIIRDKKSELDKFNKAKLKLTEKLKKVTPVKKSVKSKVVPSGYKEDVVNSGLRKYENKFVKEKQALEAKVFSQELELEKRRKELEQALAQKSRNEEELRTRIFELEKEKNLSEKGVEDDPDKSVSFETVLKEKEELERQIKLLKESFQEQLGNMYYYLGLAYTQAKIYPDAIQAYVTSLEYKPDNSEAHCNLGLLYSYQGNEPQKALYHMNQALKLNPKIENNQTIKALVDIAEEEKTGLD